MIIFYFLDYINPLKAELNPIRHLLALAGAHHILHVSRVRVKYRSIFVCRHALPVLHLRSYILPSPSTRNLNQIFR